MITGLPAAYMAVGLYNLAVGGNWITWRVFLFPLFIKKYMIARLGIRILRREDAREDTYAFGIDIPELYSILGWETRSYTTDWADVGITGDAIPNKIIQRS